MHDYVREMYPFAHNLIFIFVTCVVVFSMCLICNIVFYINRSGKFNCRMLSSATNLHPQGLTHLSFVAPAKVCAVL